MQYNQRNTVGYTLKSMTIAYKELSLRAREADILGILSVPLCITYRTNPIQQCYYLWSM